MSERTVMIDYSKIFIVHGHDGEIRERVARIVEKQKIRAVILNEQANSGMTIIEKLENVNDVGAAICLFTADDVGKEKNDEALRARARQNVVLETGYFFGKLGRKRTIIIADPNVELPSDMAGIVYDDTLGLELSLLKELRALGYSIDMNELSK